MTTTAAHTGPSTTSGHDCVTSLLAAIRAGTGVPDGVFAPTATVDATVPNWRFTIRGADAIREQLSGWYADAASFEELDRIPIEGGELVRFMLTWSEHGVPHAVHQSHIIEVSDGYIAAVRMFCGGRWDASLLAQMGATDASV